MAISDISLTTGMRNNLLALQKTSAQLTTTQDRLSTGKKVNSALDNPTNFFAAQSHMARASDLNDRKDGMTEAIQTVKAADAGISAITALINSAKGLASAAAGTSNTTNQEAYYNQYTAIQEQITTLASDSGYRGTNLLTGGSLTVQFSETTDVATLSIAGTDTSATGLNLDATAGNSWSAAAGVGVQSATSDLAIMESALNTLRTTSTSLASNLSVVTARQDFTNNLIATLQTGADNLTLADMNNEGANMLMLQTRQSLGTTALSLSSQAAQSVLRLF
ncbi:MAG: flagellin [Geobacteraceae bacterium GWC2_53_11]|nr:MAG: flagellin [Geobacteraceae bacterium GWC2_53_11]